MLQKLTLQTGITLWWDLVKRSCPCLLWPTGTSPTDMLWPEILTRDASIEIFLFVLIARRNLSIYSKFFFSWSCWIIESKLEGVGEGLPFLFSSFHKNTSEWMELGLLLVVAFSLLGRIPMLNGSAVAGSRGSKLSLWGFESRPGIYHLRDLKQNTSVLCSSVSSSIKKKKKCCKSHEAVCED